MRLATLHSDRVSPSLLMGLYVCPECGVERRVPMESPTGEPESEVA